jgi:NADH-quinone oxidoreductase subunit H
MLLIWSFDAAAQRRAREAEEQDEADAASEAERGFPVPPMDLPHYHGSGPATAPVAAPADDDTTIKEVTGA